MSHKGHMHAMSIAYNVSQRPSAPEHAITMSHRGREHMCILSMLYTKSYRGGEHLCKHHLCCLTPKTIARVQPDCVEPTDKHMWCVRCVQCSQYAWCTVHYGNGLLKHILLFLQGMLCGGVSSSRRLQWGLAGMGCQTGRIQCQAASSLIQICSIQRYDRL